MNNDDKLEERWSKLVKTLTELNESIDVDRVY